VDSVCLDIQVDQFRMDFLNLYIFIWSMTSLGGDWTSLKSTSNGNIISPSGEMCGSLVTHFSTF